MIVKYSDFVNELFGFDRYKYDDIAKSNFNKLLENLDAIRVQKYADYKIEAIINMENSKLKVEERKVVGLKKQGEHGVEYTPPTSIQDSISKIDYSNQIKIEVMKNYSKHRITSKFFGKKNENTLTLSINGRHFVSDVRGEEGKSLVSSNITKLFWNLLVEVNEAQEDFRKRLIDIDRNL